MEATARKVIAPSPRPMRVCQPTIVAARVENSIGACPPTEKRKAKARAVSGTETKAETAAAIEFLLEGLHLNKRLNKDKVGGKTQYRG